MPPHAILPAGIRRRCAVAARKCEAAAEQGGAAGASCSPGDRDLRDGPSRRGIAVRIRREVPPRTARPSEADTGALRVETGVARVRTGVSQGERETSPD